VYISSSIAESDCINASFATGSHFLREITRMLGDYRSSSIGCWIALVYLIPPLHVLLEHDLPLILLLVRHS
jgi:hypothetical protein